MASPATLTLREKTAHGPRGRLVYPSSHLPPAQNDKDFRELTGKQRRKARKAANRESRTEPLTTPAAAALSDAQPTWTRTELEGWTVKQLKILAHDLDVHGYSTLKKADLIDLLLKNS